jgi:imidazolonepropionase
MPVGNIMHLFYRQTFGKQSNPLSIMMRILGPFAQILTMQSMPLRGAIPDERLHILSNAGVCIEHGKIIAIDGFDRLRKAYAGVAVEQIEYPAVLLPGFVDCHTHICFAGTRHNDYAQRIAGKSYLGIAQSGGGIWSSVLQTRAATEAELVGPMLQRIERHVQQGVTTIEIKSGYGLNVKDELKMMQAIQTAAAGTTASIVPTCLAAHIKPKDFGGNHREYLEEVLHQILPELKQLQLGNRVDIFVEETAFLPAEAIGFLKAAKAMGFQLTVHADQFTAEGSKVAVEAGAVSADHLEASGEKEIKMLAQSDTTAVVLPGACLGLGIAYAPARQLLNAGACVAIASDWNPGSAPMGQLLTQAAVMGAAQKLNTAETFAGLTYRAAHALRLHDRATIAVGQLAHLQAYPTNNYRDILYYQGAMMPAAVWTQ